jgi:hypothetical protein
MKKTNQPSIVISSCDAYSDCWEPFFKLFSTFWKDCPYPLILLSERKDCSAVNTFGLNVTSFTAAEPDETRIPWANQWVNFLRQYPEDHFFYFQEDYFLEQQVRTDYVEKAHQFTLAEDGAHFGLSLFGTRSPRIPHPRLDWIECPSWRSRYRINLQAGLWKKEAFLAYLRPDESAWGFEHFGALRARFRPDKFFMFNRNFFKDHPVVPYTGTGIIRGKWHAKMPSLFAEHGIAIDFDKRGMYKAPPRGKHLMTLISKRIQFIPKYISIVFSRKR